MLSHNCERSIVILDNWSVHHSIEAELQAHINSCGAFLVWIPPNSPDYNLIEKLWDVSLMKMDHRLTELALGFFGPTRPFAFGDFYDCLFAARLNFHTAVVTMQESYEE